MSGAINQLQMLYVPEQDRILFRVNSTSKSEFRFWITRRYALLMVKVLKEHKSLDPDLSSQTTVAAKQAVESFKKEQAIGEASFGEPFVESGNEFPLGEEAQLAFKLSYNITENGVMNLSIQPKEGQGINLAINQQLNFTLSQLLMTAAHKGEWNMEQSPAAENPMDKKNIVIN